MEEEYAIALIGLLGVLVGSGFTHYFNLQTQKQKLQFDEKHYLNNVKRQKLEEMFVLLEEAIKFTNDYPIKLIQVNMSKKIDYLDSKYSFDKFALFKNYAYMYFNDNTTLIEAIKDFELQYEKVLKINSLVISSIYSNQKHDVKKVNGQLLLEWQLAEQKLRRIIEYLPKIYQTMIDNN